MGGCTRWSTLYVCALRVCARWSTLCVPTACVPPLPVCASTACVPLGVCHHALVHSMCACCLCATTACVRTACVPLGACATLVHSMATALGVCARFGSTACVRTLVHCIHVRSGCARGPPPVYDRSGLPPVRAPPLVYERRGIPRPHSTLHVLYVTVCKAPPSPANCLRAGCSSQT